MNYQCRGHHYNSYRLTVIKINSQIKDCQVVATRISRELGGRDDSTELQVGAVEETQLYNVSKINFHVLVPNSSLKVPQISS